MSFSKLLSGALASLCPLFIKGASGMCGRELRSGAWGHLLSAAQVHLARNRGFKDKPSAEPPHPLPPQLPCLSRSCKDVVQLWFDGATSRVRVQRWLSNLGVFTDQLRVPG